MVGGGVHLYMCVCVYEPPKSLDFTLAVDSPFQTLAVDFYRLVLQLMLSSFSKSRIS